jgi:hypothetical protein
MAFFEVLISRLIGHLARHKDAPAQALTRQELGAVASHLRVSVRLAQGNSDSNANGIELRSQQLKPFVLGSVLR